MNQELKILRDRLRESGGDGAILHCTRDGYVLQVTGYTLREVVQLLDTHGEQCGSEDSPSERMHTE